MLQPAITSAATEVLAGLVERVTFHNDENGFCVLRVKARGQRDLITVLGHAAMISAGEFVQASGAWVNDRAHGVQFRASFLKAMPPTTTEVIERYLGSGMIRGIGPVYARKLLRGGRGGYGIKLPSPAIVAHRRSHTRASATMRAVQVKLYRFPHRDPAERRTCAAEPGRRSGGC
jgi:ATP-dependent exoDNAse (exonuclease V) alpha subunit